MFRSGARTTARVARPARRGILAAAIAGVLMLTAAGCATDNGGGSAGTDDPPRITMLALSTQCAFCAKVLDGVTTTIEEAGGTLDVKQTAFDAAEQAQQANQTVAQKPDAVIVFPADATAILPSLQRLTDAGIKVVVVDSLPDRAEEDLWDAYRGADDIGYGTSAAEAMVAGLDAKGLPLEGEILVVTGTPNSPATILRLEAFEDTLADLAPGITIAAVEPGNWDQTAAQTAAAGLFTRFAGTPLLGVYAQADNMAAGVVTAARGAGLDPQSMVILGSNCSAEGVELLASGDIFATFLDDPREAGRDAATAALALAAGETVEKYSFIPGPTITADNVSDCDDAIL